MANAATTKPSQSNAPASKTPPANPTPKGDAKPAPGSTETAVPAAADLAHTTRIVVTEPAEATDPVPESPEGSETNAEPPAAVAQTTNATLGFFNEDMPILPEGKYKLRPLSQSEMDELEVNEKTVRVGLPQFLAVAQALLNIKKKKLWRLYARSFPDYCDKRLGISREWAHMQTYAAEAMQNLLTSGEQMVLPTTERQLRFLAGLDAKVQVEAWKLALQKAAGKKVTGKQVEDAVKELSGNVATQNEWLAKIRHLLVNAGYEADFVQPVDVGEKEWIDFWHEPSNVYIKLIDEPSLSSMGICLAMREQKIDCQVVVNSGSLRKKKLTAHNDGTLDRLLDPVLSVFMHNLGAFLERDDNLYEAGELAKDSTLELKLAEGENTATLRLALAVQKAAQPAETQPDEDEPTEGQPVEA